MSDEEIQRLLEERDLFLREFLRTRQSLDELTKLVAKQNDRLDELLCMLRRREAQLKRAERMNRKLRKKLGLDDPEPDPEPDPPAAPESPEEPEPPEPSDATDSNDSSKGSDEGSKSSDEAPKPKGSSKRKRGGRRRPPSHLPRSEEQHLVCACASCGGKNLSPKDFKTSSKLDVQPFFIHIRQLDRQRAFCNDCGHTTTAPMPPMPVDRAGYTCRFIAWVVVMKFVLLVPLDRIHALLAAQGVHIAKSTLVSLIERAATLADAVDGEHWRQLRAGPYICFDGTGLKTLIAGQSKAWDAYMEVYTRDALTVFQFDLTKHADRLRARLHDYQGVLVCDAESRNGAGAPQVTGFAYCNAHPRRKFREAEKSHPHRAAQGGRFIAALFDLENLAADMGLVGEELVAFRQRRTRRVLRRFRAWLERVVVLYPLTTDPLRQVSQYYLNHFDNLTRFVSHAELPLDNNASEREFQRHAKLRYASLFAGSVEGGHRWATLMGVVRTAQKCDLDVLAYLTWMFERRGTHRALFGMKAKELTPMAYRDRLATERLAA